MILVTPETKSPDIREITLSAPFCNRDDVIRIPKAAAPRMQTQLAAQSSTFPDGNQLKSAIKFKRV
jgi:hypothetical protein